LPGNWKLEAIIRVIAEANEITARDIANRVPQLNTRQIGQYINYYMENKFVKSIKIPAHENSTAPWIKLYSLTEASMDKYRRLYVG